MKRRIGTILICILLLVSSLVIVFPVESVKASGNTLYVGGDGPGNYTRIQDAIDDASDGDTVFVYNGTYYENITVDKSIDLIGEDRQNTIINGNYNIIPVLIFSSHTLISNFCIKKSEQSGFGQGVFIGDLNRSIWFENITVSNCIITQNGKGICVQYISNITIKNCDIHNNLAASIVIHLGAKNIHIFNCTIRNNGMEISGPDHIKSGGINCYDNMENVTISHSSIYDNIGMGIDLRRGRSYDVHNNNIYNNSWSGIHLSSTENFYIHQNNLTKNLYQGIHANLIKDGIISDNFIHGNGFKDPWPEYFAGGINFGLHSKDVLIKNNNISYNTCFGVIIFSSSFCNITQNRFISNNLSEIDLRGCEYIEVKDNILNENRFGIRLINQQGNKTYHCKYCKILNNYFLSLDYYTEPYLAFFGSTIYLSESDYNIINNNTIIHTQIMDNDNWFNYKAGISCEKSNENTFYKNIIKDSRYGFKARNSMNNVIKQNSFIHNLKNGIYLSKSSDNLIQSNNLINNTNQAFFENGFNRWKSNYWQRPRIFPKMIFGKMRLGSSKFNIPWINIDWHPAKEPYDIT